MTKNQIYSCHAFPTQSLLEVFHHTTLILSMLDLIEITMKKVLVNTQWMTNYGARMHGSCQLARRLVFGRIASMPGPYIGIDKYVICLHHFEKKNKTC